MKLNNSITYTYLKAILRHSPVKNIFDFIKNVNLYDELKFLKYKTSIRNNVNLQFLNLLAFYTYILILRHYYKS